MNLQSILINDKKVLLCNKESLLSTVHEQNKILVSINAEAIMKDDLRFTEIINTNIGYADGVGTILAVKRYFPDLHVEKIAGVELWLDILGKAENKDIYLVGGTQEVIEKVAHKIALDFPRVNLIGFRNGYLQTREEKNDLINKIASTKPDIVVIAMGQPIQEYLADNLYHVHPALYLCVGGSFDIYAGIKKRAPSLVIKFGLEWFYRFLQEPKRWKRYLSLIVFLKKLLFKEIQCEKS